MEPNKKLKEINEEISDVMYGVFEHDLLVDYQERLVLAGLFRSVAFDALFGVDVAQELLKLTGVLEWLRETGKIDEEQDEDLQMLLNRVEGCGADG